MRYLLTFSEFLNKLSKSINEGYVETPEDLMTNPFIKPNGPVIYAFITDKVDAIKIGYTDQHPMKRIAQWQEKYGKNDGEVVCIGWWSCSEFDKTGERVFFWDHAVHKKVEEKGFKNIKKDEFKNFLTEKGKVIEVYYSSEFFRKYKDVINGNLPADREELSKELIEDIINEMKDAIKSGDKSRINFKLYKFEDGKTSTKEADKVFDAPDSYPNTQLQEDCIGNGVQAISQNKKNLLMAAVMRFGKTHASYEIVKNSGMKKVIIVSAKADVRDSWRNDINHKDFYKDFVFVEITANNTLVSEYDPGLDRLHSHVLDYSIQNKDIFQIYKDKTVCMFFTLQDLTGSIDKMKLRHSGVLDTEFDMMIVDETHYGSHGPRAGRATGLNRLEPEDIENIEAEDEDFEKNRTMLKGLNIKKDITLQVSGTPYYILASNEMLDPNAEIISKVSYTDMIEARDEWEKSNPDIPAYKSPYFGIPTLHKIGLNLSKECREAIAKKGETADISSLFRVKGNKLYYYHAVESLMKRIFGDGTADELSILKNKNVEGNKTCRHTLVVLPRKEACQLVHKLLETVIDTNEREILQVTGTGQNIDTIEELNAKLEQLDKANKKSVILTVNRFLTGVSMPLVDSMIYLKNSSSPQEYDQSIFRLCTRNVKTVKDPENGAPEKVNMKDNVYLIDFNISNMFTMSVNTAMAKSLADGKTGMENVKKYIQRDLKATPIFVEDESQDEVALKMHEMTGTDILKVMTKYNAEKDIDDLLDEDSAAITATSSDSILQSLLMNSKIGKDQPKANKPQLNQDGKDSIETGLDIEDYDTEDEDKNRTSGPQKNNASNKLIKDTKEKLMKIVKSAIYCNLAMQEPFASMDEIILKGKDTEIEYTLSGFGISIEYISKIWSVISTAAKSAINAKIYQAMLFVNELSQKEFENKIEKFSKITGNEVVTPVKLVDKMIAKLEDSDYENAESILLVNEKQGEFFKGLVKKFGDKIIPKCKVICSSPIGRMMTEKIIKTYSKTIKPEEIIIPMTNDDIKQFLSYPSPKKFDTVLMNPPYDGSLHLKFLEKAISIADKVVSVQPVDWLLRTPNYYKENSQFYKWQKVFKRRLCDIEIFSSIDEVLSIFRDTRILNMLAIYSFNENESNTLFDEITINSEEAKICKKIFDYAKTDNIEMHLEKNKRDGYRVKFTRIGGGSWTSRNKHTLPSFKEIVIDGKLKNGKEHYEMNSINQYTKKTSVIPESLSFNTEEDANDFIDIYKTDIMQFYLAFIHQDMHIHPEYLPYFDKKHLKMRDEELKNFFNLTKEEIEFIENYD